MKLTGINVMTGDAVEVTASKVIDVVDTLISRPAGLPYLAPAWIDLQVNGFAGVDYCSADSTVEQIQASVAAQHATGVGRIYATVITGSQDNMLDAIRNLGRARESVPGIEGLHIEGPHICPEDGPRGAHPRHCVRRPDIEEYQRWQDASNGFVRLITIAPEWPEAPAYIERVVRDGVAVSVGHTKANAEQIATAVSAGATLSTHLGNGAHSEMKRHPNYIWDQMAEDRLAASFIVDGIHLGAAFLKVALLAKGIERSVLVTDAVMPAGCAPGRYRLGEVDVELHADGSVRLLDGDRLAGSALTMDRAIGNVMRMAGVSLREAVTMATTNAARVGRIGGRMRGLAAGERADLVQFTVEGGEVKVMGTWISGDRV